eukprot:13738990-Ditylum_brightwellii.AAC.1
MYRRTAGKYLKVTHGLRKSTIALDFKSYFKLRTQLERAVTYVPIYLGKSGETCDNLSNDSSLACVV